MHASTDEGAARETVDLGTSRWTSIKRTLVGLNQVYLLLVLILLSSIFVPGFLSIQNALNLLRNFSFLGIVSIGMTFVILSGQIVDLSVGSIVGFSSVMMALTQHWGIYTGFTNELSHLAPTGVLVVLVIALGAAFGLANGLIITKLHVSGFVTTLGMMAFVRGLAFSVSGGGTIYGVDEITMFFGRGMVGQIPFVALLWIVLVVVGVIILTQTPFGRRFYAAGENREVAFLSGMNPDTYTIVAYAVSGALSAVAGICMTGRLANGEPSLGESWELYAIAAVIIGGTSFEGGRGGLWRTVVGVIVVRLIQNVLGVLGVPPHPQTMIMGLVLIGAVVLQRTTQPKAL